MKNRAVFAAGCFWGVQYYFDQVPGVTKTLVGYTGGHTENPTYEEVCYESTGHAEAVAVDFDPTHVTYETLVKQFFRMHDPTQLNRQGPDIGDQYRSAIFYSDEDQRVVAERIFNELQLNFQKPIATHIQPATKFYLAEAYHQKYTGKTGRGMCHIPYEAIQ